MNQIKCLEDKSSFIIKLGGKNSIDAEVYNNIIHNTISLMKASVALVAPNAYLKLEVEANSRGSFLNYLTILIQENKTLLQYGKEVLEVTAVILSAVCSWIKIKQHLKGQNKKNIIYNIKDSNLVTITNSDGEELEIEKEVSEKFFEDKTIDSFISKLFEETNKENRAFFEIIPDKKTRLNRLIIKSSDFDNMSKNIINGYSIEHIILPPSVANLLIKQVDFLGDASWGFIYNKSIKARIKDRAFLERVRTCEIKLGAGYRLNCSLQIEYDLQEGEIIKDTEKYTVLEVFDVLEPIKPKQKEFFEPLS